MYASGKVSNPVDGVEPEGCEGGTDESTELLMMSVEPYVEDSGDILHVHLRGTRMRPGNANGPGSQMDGPRGQSDVLKGQADRPRGWTDTLSVSDSAETAVISHGERVSMYLGVRDAKHPVQETDGVGIHVDASVGWMDTPSVEMDADTPAKAPENVRTRQKKMKPPDLPMEAARVAPDEPDGCRNHTDRSGVHRDLHSIGNERETGANETENVRTSQNDSKAPNSPYMHEIATPKPADRWKRVSADDTYVYLPWNAPIEALSQMFEFGQVEGADEAIAPSFECEGAGDGDGDRDRDDGSMGGTTSSGSVHLIQVNAALLAGDS